ncbi:MAG: hypothetical protein PHT40_03725 [Patescibacteria group bacterium]|nr:hypothetical protein [Patescibacteria group bacterium]
MEKKVNIKNWNNTWFCPWCEETVHGVCPKCHRTFAIYDDDCDGTLIIFYRQDTLQISDQKNRKIFFPRNPRLPFEIFVVDEDENFFLEKPLAGMREIFFVEKINTKRTQHFPFNSLRIPVKKPRPA